MTRLLRHYYWSAVVFMSGTQLKGAVWCYGSLNDACSEPLAHLHCEPLGRGCGLSMLRSCSVSDNLGETRCHLCLQLLLGCFRRFHAGIWSPTSHFYLYLCLDAGQFSFATSVMNMFHLRARWSDLVMTGSQDERNFDGHVAANWFGPRHIRVLAKLQTVNFLQSH